jgi:hypothetical protein
MCNDSEKRHLQLFISPEVHLLYILSYCWKAVHRIILVFVTRHSSIYATDVLKKSWRVKSHKSNIRKHCTEGFLISSMSECSRCAEEAAGLAQLSIPAFFLQYKHNIPLSLLFAFFGQQDIHIKVRTIN